MGQQGECTKRFVVENMARMINTAGGPAMGVDGDLYSLLWRLAVYSADMSRNRNIEGL